MTPAALWTAAVVTAAAILSLDLLLPLGAAGAVLYVLLVLLALKSPSRNTAFGLAVAGSVLTVLGFFLSEPRAMLSVALTNRALALFAIWISVLPVVRYQRIRFGGMKNRIDVEDIMNSVMEAIIISDERGIMLAVNKSAEAMFGYKAKELIGKSAAILRPEPERTQYQKRIDEFDRTGRGLFVDQGIHQERRLRKDGSIFPMEMHVGELWRNGRRLFVGTTRDVSARQKAEDKQCQTQELFEKAFQGAPLMMCLTNLENHMYLDVNDAWLKGVGQSREKIIGQTSVEFPLWVSETQRAKAHKELKETGSLRGFEAKWRRTDNSIFDVRIQAERLDIDGKPAILSIARDVTKETRAEQALRLSEARFRDVAEISSDWIWETDANNRISYISDRVRDALGFDPKVVIGSVRGMSDRIADKGSKAWQRHLKDVEARRPFRNFVYQHYHHEGGIRHIQISGKPVFAAVDLRPDHHGAPARRKLDRVRHQVEDDLLEHARVRE